MSFRVLKTLLCLCLFLAAGCENSKKNVIKIAASPVPHAQILEVVKEDLIRQGITLKVIEIDDYQLPNRLLAEGEVDANFFQHEPFMRAQEKVLGAKFAILAVTHIEPMGLYSCRWQALSDLPKGALIAIPCDPSNEARALQLLSDAKMISLDSNKNGYASIQTILSNPSCYRFNEVDAALLPRILRDVDGAVIPANYALQAGLCLCDALIKEDISSSFANIVVVRQEDLNNENLKRLKEALLSEKVKKFIEEKYQGNLIAY